jgi:hypothetical protein
MVEMGTDKTRQDKLTALGHPYCAVRSFIAFHIDCDYLSDYSDADWARDNGNDDKNVLEKLQRTWSTLLVGCDARAKERVLPDVANGSNRGANRKCCVVVEAPESFDNQQRLCRSYCPQNL